MTAMSRKIAMVGMMMIIGAMAFAAAYSYDEDQNKYDIMYNADDIVLE